MPFQVQTLLLNGIGGAITRIGVTIIALIWPIKFFKLFPMKGAIMAVCFLASFALHSPYSYYVISVGVGCSNAIASVPLLNVAQVRCNQHTPDG